MADRIKLPTKDAGIRIRVERGLRDEFVRVCRESGRSAAQVLREHMRSYVERAELRAGGRERCSMRIPKGFLPDG